MTTGPNKFLDDFARLMTEAAGAAQGMTREAQAMFQAQAEKMMSNMDMVQREEFEAVKEMALKALEENEALKARIDALEAKKPAPARKPAAKRTTTRKPAAKKD